MFRSTNRCVYGHTPQSPHKMRVRGNWLRALDSSKDIIAISHALCDSLVTLGWIGRIKLCDIDPGVRAQIQFARRGQGTTPADYPTLNIEAPGKSIEETVLDYLGKYSAKDLAAVDLDLTSTLTGDCIQHLMRIGSLLVEHEAYGTLVLLTFRNGRDEFGRLSDRITWLRNHLPAGLRYISHEKYTSLKIGSHVEREKGSSMCTVCLEVGPPQTSRADFIRALVRKAGKSGIAESQVREQCLRYFPRLTRTGLNSWLCNARKGTGQFRGQPQFRSKFCNGGFTLFTL